VRGDTDGARPSDIGDGTTISIAFKRHHGGLPAGESHGDVRLERTKPCLARFQLLTSANEGLEGRDSRAFRRPKSEKKTYATGGLMSGGPSLAPGRFGMMEKRQSYWRAIAL
jgi:hypothetical protein